MGTEFRAEFDALAARCITVGQWSGARFAALGHAAVPRLPHPCRWFQCPSVVHDQLSASADSALAPLLPDRRGFAKALRAALREVQLKRWAEMSPEEREAIGAQRADWMTALWQRRSPEQRASIRRALCFRWTCARRFAASVKRKMFLSQKTPEELRRSGQRIRSALTDRQREQFRNEIQNLYTSIVVQGKLRRDVCSAPFLKALQGRFRVFKASLDALARAQASALFVESSKQSKAASRTTHSLNVRAKLRADITDMHAQWRQGTPLTQDTEAKTMRRLTTAYTSVKSAPPDLLALVEEMRGGDGQTVCNKRNSATKLGKFLRDVAEYETRLATRGPSDGVLTTLEARRLAGRFCTFRPDLSPVDRERYDRVYLAYLWRNGVQARRGGHGAQASRRDGPKRKRGVTEAA